MRYLFDDFWPLCSSATNDILTISDTLTHFTGTHTVSGSSPFFPSGVRVFYERVRNSVTVYATGELYPGGGTGFSAGRRRRTSSGELFLTTIIYTHVRYITRGWSISVRRFCCQSIRCTTHVVGTTMLWEYIWYSVWDGLNRGAVVRADWRLQRWLYPENLQ